MITIQNVSKQYSKSVHALRGLNLQIRGGMFGLLGPNGAGKTTLMRILAGLIKPTSGSVHIFGHDVTTAAGKRQIKSRLGYLPQELGLYPDLTGAEFLDYVAILKGVSNKKARREQTAVLLQTVGLNEAQNRRIKTYSGGMKRRLGIAQALLGQPKLLIVDEPTVGLDPEERVRLRNLLADMAQQCIVLLSTHIVEDISQSCREVAIINNGQLTFCGSPGELISQARGKTWLISTKGERPNAGLTLVSTLQMQDSMQFRVLGTPDAHAHAQSIEPSLEDGYIWHMRQQVGDKFDQS